MRLKNETAFVSMKAVGLSFAIAAGLMIGAASAHAEGYKLDYKVSHSKYGNIGSFSNTVDTEGKDTTITTRENIAVKVIGITAFKQEAQRVEKWNGDRLVSLHAVTNMNGKQSPVDGVAQGDKFVITSPKGVTEAPANIRVANPWSPTLMNGDTILSPDDGTVSKVQITSAPATVNVGGSDVQAKLYDIQFTGSEKKYQVWFDPSGTPVMFNMHDKDGTVTFTLNSKTPVNPAIASAK